MSETNPHYYRAVVPLAGGSTVTVECFDIMDALGFDKNYRLGCVLKYLWRAGKKTADPLVDLKKARTYIDSEIARLERKEPPTGRALEELEELEEFFRVRRPAVGAALLASSGPLNTPEKINAALALGDISGKHYP
jgi:hypothetical protein